MDSLATLPARARLAAPEQSPVADGLDLCRVRGEYLEMPGLCPTQRQAQRLWALSCERCDVLLSALIQERFLRRTADGRFIRFGGDARMESE